MITGEERARLLSWFFVYEYMERAEPGLGGYLKQEQTLGGYQGDS
jgi:hypothetical protein